MKPTPIKKVKKGGDGSVLDSEDARTIVEYCQKPRTTEKIRGQFDSQVRNKQFVVLGGYNFNDYMKRLEEEKYLIHNKEDGTWMATQEAIDYILKYHGY